MAERVDFIFLTILCGLSATLGYNWSAATAEIYINFMILLAIVGTILGYLIMYFKQKYDQEHQNELIQIQQQIELKFQSQQQQQLQQLLQFTFRPVIVEILDKQDNQTKEITEIQSIVNAINSTINKFLADYDEYKKIHEQRFENLEANHHENISNHDQLIKKLFVDLQNSKNTHQEKIANLETNHDEINKNQDERISKLETDHSENLIINDKRITELEIEIINKHEIQNELISKLKTDCQKSSKHDKERLDNLEIANHQESNPFSDYNILLLGEIGVGKSTAINSFANYMKYAKFEDSLVSNVVEFIPSKFIEDPSTLNLMNIESDKDFNEQGGNGSSTTKKPRTYKFNYNNKVIRFIDTPGIGDTSGPGKDRENFRQIFSLLQCYKNLHGIIILMKSIETKRTNFLQYCFSELLTHLPKSICENVVFCFTYSRHSFYAPGDAFSNLKMTLKNELNELSLKLTPNKNCFFSDNEAYQFLVAKKRGMMFPKNQINSYRESWNKSYEQFVKMLAKIIGNRPHELQNTTPKYLDEHES